MKKFAILALAFLFAAPLAAQQLPSPRVNNITVEGAIIGKIPTRQLDTPSASGSQKQITVSSQPAYNHPEALGTEFDGDFSKTFLPLEYNVTGAGTMGDGSIYWSPAVTPYQSLVNYSSGINTSDSTNSGRSGFATYRNMLNHGGQGDAASYYSYCQLSGAGKPSATSWLANPACIGMAGDFGALQDGGYLQGVGDLNFSDNGHDVAAIADVRNMLRNNNTAALGQIWMGYRMQSAGSKAVEVMLSGTGPIKVGLDTTQMTSLDAAVNMAANQKIVFNSTASPINGVNWYGNTTGGAYISYSTSTSLGNPSGAGVEIGVGSTPRFSVSSSGISVNGALTLTSTTAFTPQNTAWNQANDADASYYIFKKTRAASGAGSAAQVGDTLGTLMFQSADTGGTIRNAAYISSVVTAVGGSSVTSDMTFNLTGSTPLRLISTGLIFTGTISSNGSAGVSCTGINTTTFRSVNGIVTAC